MHNCTSAAPLPPRYYDSFLGRRRVNRADHAVHSGMLAGYNMASGATEGTEGGEGARAHSRAFRSTSFPKAYTHQPVFRSRLVDVSISGIGDVSSALETVGDDIACNE